MIKIVNVRGLNFRKGPGTSYNVIRVLIKGEEVEIISESNGWSKIRSKSIEGYVASKYLSNKEEKEESLDIKVVNVGGLNFRKGPGTSYNVIRVLIKGEEVEVISENNGWSKIRNKSMEGYAASKYLSNEEEKEESLDIKVVNVEGLNFRKGPGTSYSIIRVLIKGEEVEVISESNGWSKIRSKSMEGYVASKYLSNKEEKEESLDIKVVNVEGLNFRKGPGISYSVIRVLTKGEEVEIISESNGWSKIRNKSTEGYVASKYLSYKHTIDNNIILNAINIAKSKLGCKYIWGDEGPNTFDCSGFIYYIFKLKLGVNIPRVSKEQSKYGTLIDRKSLKPGDLVFFDTQGANDLNVSHVGLYIGNNEFIHAATGKTMKVTISKLEGYYSRQYVNARRIV